MEKGLIYYSFLDDFLNNIGFILIIFSNSILIIGLILLLRNRIYNWVLLYLFFLWLFEFLSIYIGVILKKNDNIIFILSFILHLIFLTNYYFKNIFHKNNILKIIIYVTGLIMAVLNLYSTVDFFKDYTRFMLSLTITIYSLIYIYNIINGTLKNHSPSNILNYTILLFFCTDAFLAIATDYLVSNHLNLVSWFWFFRALLLQTFYIGLIYYAFKSHKTQSN